MNMTELKELIFVQRKELGELFGFEGRNRFQIYDAQKNPVGYTAEESRGIFGFLMRQFLGHWRSFKLTFFDQQRNVLFWANHPFRFYFERLEVFTPDGVMRGALQKRFSIFSKKFDVEDAYGNCLFEVNSPLWHIWTFRFFNRQGQQIASVEKKWGGLMKEFFLDADSFKLTISPTATISYEETLTLIAASFFIDLQYFERKAGN